MANLFVNLPIPAGNGVGAGVDVSAFGGTKTITVQGAFSGVVTIEYSEDGTTFAQLITFAARAKKTFTVAARFMRVRRAGVGLIPGTPNVDVASDSGGQQFANLPVPAANGVGAAVNVSLLGTLNTVVVGGPFTGNIIIEISEDGTGWAQCLYFGAGGGQTKRFTAQFMRVRRQNIGVVPGTPVVDVGAANDPTVNSPAAQRIIRVAALGGDVTTIAAGLAAASALVPPPSATDPATVLVFPGVYPEVPLTVPAFVSLGSVGGPEVTVVEALTATSPLLTGSANAAISDITVRGADGAGGQGVRMAVAGILDVRDVVMRDCTTAMLCTGVGSIISAIDCSAIRVVGQTMTTGFHADLGGLIRLQAPFVIGDAAARIATGLRSTGAGGSRIRVNSLTTLNVDEALFVDGVDANIQINGSHLRLSVNAMRIGATGGLIDATAIHVDESTTWDLLVDSAAGMYLGSGSIMRSDRISAPAAATVISSHVSEFPGDEGAEVVGEFHVGTPEMPSESAFGEGDSHIRGLSAFLSTVLDAGPFTDVTDILSSVSGSTTVAFPTGAASNALFIGGDLAFTGIKLATTAAVALGAASLAIEISDGVGGWIAIDVCVCDSLAPYLSHAEDIFGRVAIEQIRFGSVAGWAAQVINGVSKLWLRISVVGAALGTNPVIEQAKLGTNRTEINGDGVTEHFGTAEVVKDMLMHQRLTDDLGGASPGNVAIAFSAGISLTLIENRFNNGVTDGVGAIVTVPEGLDTSMPTTLHVRWIPAVNTAGDVEFETDLVEVKLGDTLDGTLVEVSDAVIQSVGAGQIDVLREVIMSFMVVDLIPGEQFAFSFFRDASAGNPDDTLAGSIEVVSMELRGTFWR